MEPVVALQDVFSTLIKTHGHEDLKYKDVPSVLEGHLGKLLSSHLSEHFDLFKILFEKIKAT